MAENNNMLSSYKSKLIDFRRIFRNTNAADAELISDYTCAINAGTPKILQHGRMYITTNYICFYSKLFNDQKICIDFKTISEFTKEKTAILFPNAIQIVTVDGTKYFFASFASRDKTFQVIERLWNERKLNKFITPELFWDRVRENYGNDLGFTQEDSEYLDSRASQFIAVFNKNRRPSQTFTYSSQESVYESVADSISTHGSIEDENERIGEDIEVSSSDNSSNYRNSPLLPMKIDKRSFSLKENMSDPEIQFSLQNRKISQNNIANGLSKNRRYSVKPTQSILFEDSSSSSSILPQAIASPLNYTIDESPAICQGHDHFPNSSLDTEINLPVSTIWQFVFTDHSFYRNLCSQRSMTDITQAQWPSFEDPDIDLARVIYYVVNLKNRIGPKKSPTVEKQVVLKGSQENYMYIIESTVRSMDVPLADSFHVAIRYCLLYISANRTRIKSSFKVVWDKSVFFPTKSIIESTVKNGCIEYCRDMKAALLIEAAKICPTKSKINNIPNQSHSSIHKEPSCIEEKYQDTSGGEDEDTHKNDYHTSIIQSISSISDYNVSWRSMVVVCFIALLAMYFLKEMYVTNEIYLTSNIKSSCNSKNLPLLQSQKNSYLNSESISEMLKLIKEVKSAIDILNENLQKLNQSFAKQSKLSNKNC